MEYCTGTVGARFGERFKSNKGEKEQECRGIHKVLKKTKRKKCCAGHRRDSQKSKMPKREVL